MVSFCLHEPKEQLLNDQPFLTGWQGQEEEEEEGEEEA